MAAPKPYQRPLESFSPVVLARWIRLKGVSRFDGEIEAIERWQLQDDIAAGRVIEVGQSPEADEAVADGVVEAIKTALDGEYVVRPGALDLRAKAAGEEA